MNAVIQVYGLMHPETGVVWYVGVSGHSSLRARNHQNKGAAKRVREWVASLKRKPIKTVLDIVEMSRWREQERHWIAKCRKKNPALLNVAEGGNGGDPIPVHQKKKTISIYLNPEQLAQLKLWNQDTGASVAELIRRAIDAALKTRTSV